ncbi:MAG: aldehyde dehydrogenase (NAD+) [Bradymonadia bacterium]|jgi:aldehyde dehydrogenase (NAD+)
MTKQPWDTLGLDLTNTLDGVRLGAAEGGACGEAHPVRCSIDGENYANVRWASVDDLDIVAASAIAAHHAWRVVPAPIRGAFVREIGVQVTAHKDALAAVISIEAGKTTSEALGEVQEWIDMCEFAVGLSRQLHGLTIVSERPEHRMMEQWHPLGPIAVISAFNFPMAVWAWNAMLGFVCGDSVVWKPSEKTPLCAIAAHRMVELAMQNTPGVPKTLSSVVVGAADIGASLAADDRFPLVSATGSVPMGKRVAAVVGGRLGRALLELGGNNAAIVTPSADIDLALRGIVFAAAGTCGQRCTSLRRLIVHESLVDALTEKLVAAYGTLSIGDPREDGVLVGPLVDEAAFDAMAAALTQAQEEGGTLLCGGRRVTDGVPGGVYVEPAIVRVSPYATIMQQETFAPILYVVSYRDFAEAIALQNGVPQGLSSAVFTESMREAERFLSTAGSDCGIANVNIGTSGAEIGGAFGGEKETGGGRESGSDAWKNYMRRTTNTVNYGDTLPLAQGVRFDV